MYCTDRSCGTCAPSCCPVMILYWAAVGSGVLLDRYCTWENNPISIKSWFLSYCWFLIKSECFTKSLTLMSTCYPTVLLTCANNYYVIIM